MRRLRSIVCSIWHALFLSVALHCACLSGWVEGQSCGPRVSPRLLREIPCDMNSVAYCAQPGSAYPWSAVRRYIFENQGFMKRMYGEHRQSQIIHEEMLRMNDLYETPDLNVFRSAKSTDDLDTKIAENQSEILTSQAIAFEVHLNATPVESARLELDSNETTTGIEAEVNESETVYSTTPTADRLVNVSSPALLDVTADQESETTASTEAAENLVGEDKADSKPKGFNACPVTQEVVAPYWANNTRGETLALLNVYPFEQYIHWEKCSFEGEQMLCREGCRCEQQFRLHRLLAFDPKNECRGVFADWFRFPGCCVCICYDNHERINNRKARL